MEIENVKKLIKKEIAERQRDLVTCQENGWTFSRCNAEGAIQALEWVLKMIRIEEDDIDME